MDADLIKLAVGFVMVIIGWIIKIEINRSTSNTKISAHSDKLEKHSKRFEEITPRIQKVEMQMDNKIDRNDLYEKLEEFKKSIDDKMEKWLEKIEDKFKSLK